jgi:hypothetical protein
LRVKDELECGHDYLRLEGVKKRDPALCRECGKEVPLWRTEAEMIELNALYMVRIGKSPKLVRAVDGEEHFHEPALSHEFIHFADPASGEKAGFSGTAWFERNARPTWGREPTPLTDTSTR